MKRNFRLVLLGMVVGCALFASQAFASTFLAGNADNELFFNNYELLFDGNGNQVDLQTNFLRGVLPGDYFMGILNIQNNDVAGTTFWAQVLGGDQVSGIFVQKVVATAAGTTPTEVRLTMTNTDRLGFTLLDSSALDLTGRIAVGEMFALYQDTAPGMTNFESNGTVQDDVAKSTDGDKILAFSVVKTTDYFYSYVDSGVPLNDNFGGRAFGGMTVTYPTDIPFVALNDPDENEINTAAEVIMSSEIEQNPAFQTGASPWQIRSNDPATLHPIPEPSTVILLGAGLIGLGFVARKRR